MRLELLYHAMVHHVRRQQPRTHGESKGNEGHEFERRHKGQCFPFLHYNADVEHRLSIASNRDTQYSRARGVTNTHNTLRNYECATSFFNFNPTSFTCFVTAFLPFRNSPLLIRFPRFTGPISQQGDATRHSSYRKGHVVTLPPVVWHRVTFSAHNSKAPPASQQGKLTLHRNDQRIQESLLFTAN